VLIPLGAAAAVGALPRLHGVTSAQAAAPRATLDGRVLSGRLPIGSAPVTLYRTTLAGSRSGPARYRPSLARSGRPDAWILALRFDGDGKSINGPGNSAIDAAGNVWVDSNYTCSRNPAAPVCGSKLFFKFTPTGRFAPGSPYTGGGVDGSGYGVAIDPRGNIWEGNFGFSSAACTSPPSHTSVSEFTPGRKPLSPDQTATSPGGFSQGGVSWPQGVDSDRQGNTGSPTAATTRSRAMRMVTRRRLPACRISESPSRSTSASTDRGRHSSPATAHRSPRRCSTQTALRPGSRRSRLDVQLRRPARV
jgi:hypothetical protein